MEVKVRSGQGHKEAPRETKQLGDSPEAGSTEQVRWWTKEDKAAADCVSYVLETLRLNQSNRFRQLCMSAMLYGNQPVWQMYGVNQLRLVRSPAVPLGRLVFNVIQSAIDTLVSKLSSDESVPYFLTKGGTYKQQKQAKALTKFSDGILYENQMLTKGPMVLRDSCILGDGLVVGYVNEHRRVRLERALATEFYIDEVEGQYGEPRSAHRVKSVDKATLAGKFKSQAQKDLIANCQRIPIDGVNQTIQVSDCIDVRESWHLPSYEGAKDGKHYITIQNGTLVDEGWPHSWFPFVRLPWSPSVCGYWSQSAAAQIQGIQLELNKLLWVQSRALHLAGAFKVWVPIDSRIVKESMDNQAGTSSYYSGSNPPQYVTVPAVHAQVIERIAQLKQDAFEQLGVSALSAMSKKPGGLDSGEALREYADIQTERFFAQGKMYQKFFQDCSLLAIRLAQLVAEEDGKYAVSRPSRAPGAKFLESIDWKDIDVDETDFVQKCWSVALLPDTPAGQMQSIAEQVQAGWLTPRQGKRLMAFPDLASAEQLSNAAEDYLDKILDKMVNGDSEDPEEDYTPPAPEDDNVLAAQMVEEYIQRAKADELPEARINLLREYAQALQAMQDEAQQPPATAGGEPPPPAAPVPPGAGAAPGGVPQAQPAQAPVSNLLPQKA